jgi:hypothetical protein
MADQDPAFSLVPLEVGATPDEALDSAEAAIFDDPFAATVEGDPPVPFGKSWAFDYQNGRFYRSAGAPAETRGVASLVEYVQTAMRTAAGVHPIFPPEFGIRRPEDFLGSADPTEALSDFEDRLRTALLAHDRIEDVRQFEAQVDLSEGIITVTNLLIVTDQEEVVPLGPTNVEVED